MSIFERVKQALSRYINLKPATAKTKIDVDNFYDESYQNWQGYLDERLQRNAVDKIKYQDYDLMDDEIPEISAALDVMADFIVYPDNVNRSQVFKVKSKKYQNKIDEIDEITQFQKIFPAMAREACKYGDNVEELVPNVGGNRVVAFKNVPLDTVLVNVKNGIKQTEPAIIQVDSANQKLASLNANECLHFSLPTSRKRYGETGKGVSRIEKARLIYRQLRLMEEGVIISRLSKANNNYAIIVDVGDLTGEDALNYVDKYRKRIARKKYIDPQTGRFSFKMNPLSAVEDILVPTRQGSGGNVIPLNQNLSRGTIEDVNYFQNKMIYASNVPKILIGKEEDVNAKSTGDIQFVSFLRMIRNMQTLLESEIIVFYKNALQTQGIVDADDLFIEWPIFGTLDEERKWRIELLKMQIAQMLGQTMMLVDDQYIYENYMNLASDIWQPLVARMDEEESMAAEEYEKAFDNAQDLTNDPNADEVFRGADDPPIKKKTKKNPKSKVPKDKKEFLQLIQPEVPEKEFKALEKIINNEVLCKTLWEAIHLTNTAGI